MKRNRSKKPQHEEQVLLIPSDIWLTHIAPCIPATDYETLLSFIGTAKVFIKFIHPTIKEILAHLSSFTHIHAAVPGLVRAFAEQHITVSRYTNHYVDENIVALRMLSTCCSHLVAYEANCAKLAARNMNTSTLAECDVSTWREQVSEILSIMRLISLHESYDLANRKGKRLDFDKDRGCHNFEPYKRPSPTTELRHVYFRNPETQLIEPIVGSPLVKVIHKFPTTQTEIIDMARSHITKKKRSAGKKEVLLHALEHAKQSYAYAFAYHLMESKFSVRDAGKRNLFRELLVSPTPQAKEPHYMHIYSTSDPVVKAIHATCMVEEEHDAQTLQRILTLKKNWPVFWERCTRRILAMNRLSTSNRFATSALGVAQQQRIVIDVV